MRLFTFPQPNNKKLWSILQQKHKSSIHFSSWYYVACLLEIEGDKIIVTVMLLVGFK